MDEIRHRSLSGIRDPTWVIGAFAVMAALLAALGLYGVLSHLVTLQRREIGIRMALGARPSQVISHVLRNALSLVVLGLVLGLAGAVALTRVMGSLLFQVSALDPVAFVAAGSTMILIGMLASFVPAGRAARVAPIDVLRDDA